MSNATVQLQSKSDCSKSEKLLTNRQRRELAEFAGHRNIFYEDEWGYWYILLDWNEYYFNSDGCWATESLGKYGSYEEIKDSEFVRKLDKVFLEKVDNRFNGFSKVLKEVRSV